MDEERKQALMKRAERVDVKEDTIDWDDEGKLEIIHNIQI